MAGMKALFDKLKPQRIQALVYQNEPNGPRENVPYELRVFNAKEKTNHPPTDSKRFFKAYVVLHSTRVVHASLVFTKNLLARQLGFRNVLIIGNCFTDEEYRGKGIYPAVLKRIRTDFADRTLIVFVDPANTASVRGLEKAGFRRLFEFVMYRFLGVCLHKRRIVLGA
jgi:RimJ/RimL family protein N-acetyltransferase